MNWTDEGQAANGSFRPVEPETLGLQREIPQLRAGSTFVPGQRVPHAGPSEVQVEVRALEDGRTALLAYSSLPHLVACLGDAQPWVEIKPTVSVSDLQVQAGVDVVVWDAELPVPLRHCGENNDG